jgi:hypothetical protein
MRRKSLTAMFVAVATLLPTLARAETTEIRCQDIEDSNRTMFCTLDSANLVVVSCDRGGNANRTINASKDDNYYMWESTPTFEIYSRYRLDRRTLQLTEGWVQKFGEKWASTSSGT